MPVTICSANSAMVALPKVYHQLAVRRGTGWSITTPISARRPGPSSPHPPTAARDAARPPPATPPAAASYRSRQRRQLAAAHVELALADLQLVLEQAARRRARGARAVLVVDAAVAGG